MAKLSTREVKGILAAEKADALGTNTSDLSKARTDALNYYLGDMSADMPKRTGWSGVVSTDVADTVDGLMPGLMDIFCGSDDVVRFDPVGPEDVQAAEQESEFVNWVFMQKNPGFSILQTAFKDGLISKTGIMKVWWETSKREERETYLDQDEEAFMMLVMDPEIEVIEHTQHEDGRHDVTIAKRYSRGCAKVENVPPEEFGVARRTKRIQDCPYCYHEPSGGRLETDLIAEGFDEEQIKSLPTYNITTGGTEKAARDSVNESATSGEADGGINPPMRPIQVTEHYCLLDYEGDGKTALYKVTTGGDDGVVLKKDGKPDIMRWDYVPFAVLHPDPIPHRFFGRSIADKTMETQRIKTALTRGLLDNVYLMNNQQIEVSESHSNASTVDDLLNKKIGGLVRTKAPGGITPIVVQAIADKIIPYLQYFDMEREWRTGVTREGQGLNAEALQNQSATAAKQIHNAAQAKLKLVARNFADGVEDLFWLLHAVIRKNGSQPETVRLRNEWTQIDPRQWKSRDDMSITVGLGSGGKQEQLAAMMALIQLQMQAVAAGMVKPKHFYQSAKDVIKLMDKRDVSLYFDDPGEDAEMETPEDPAIQKAKIDGQIKMQEMQAKAQIEKVQAEADIATNQLKVQADIALAREKAALDMQMKREEHAMKMEEARMKMVGTAVTVASKGNGTDAEGNQKPPDTDMIERLMAGMSKAPEQSKSRKSRLKKVGPGEWVKEDVE